MNKDKMLDSIENVYMSSCSSSDILEDIKDFHDRHEIKALNILTIVTPEEEAVMIVAMF